MGFWIGVWAFIHKPQSQKKFFKTVLLYFNKNTKWLTKIIIKFSIFWWSWPFSCLNFMMHFLQVFIHVFVCI